MDGEGSSEIGSGIATAVTLEKPITALAPTNETALVPTEAKPPVPTEKPPVKKEQPNVVDGVWKEIATPPSVPASPHTAETTSSSTSNSKNGTNLGEIAGALIAPFAMGKEEDKPFNPPGSSLSSEAPHVVQQEAQPIQPPQEAEETTLPKLPLETTPPPIPLPQAEAMPALGPAPEVVAAATKPIEAAKGMGAIVGGIKNAFGGIFKK